MAADYPGTAPSFTPKVDAVDYPQAVDVNELQEEITAIGTALVSGGLAHDLDPDASANNRDLGSTSKRWNQLHAKMVNFAASSELTIATGAVTAAQAYHSVDTESNAASDDLDTITAGTGMGEGAVIILRAENVARVVTVKDGSGNLLLNGDYALSATDRTITLIYDGTNWRELARSATNTTSVAFPATQSASADANTLDDYEEGTWTPADGSGATLTFTTVEAQYVKIGQSVTVSFTLTYPSTANGSAAIISGLPFTVQNTTNNIYVSVGVNSSGSTMIAVVATKNATTLAVVNAQSLAALTNANMSLLTLRATLTYRATA